MNIFLLSSELSPVDISYATRYQHCVTLSALTRSWVFPRRAILNAIRKFTRVFKFRSFHKTKQWKHTKKSLVFVLQLSRICFRILSRQSKTFVRLLQSFFFYSNRPRSIYQYSYMLRGFRDKIVTF